MEARKFQMHEKLLLDVIKKQAGSIEKAILEGVMNSIEAGATKIEIKIDAGTILINDDGKGFKSREEIEKFFETFGQPHEESEGKKWAQFRMGRGQMFAFGKNHWTTGNFEMLVDINSRLGYDLIERKAAHPGCRIAIDLYQAVSEREIYSIQRELANQVKYVNVPVIVNDKQVNSDPEKSKWDHESDENAFMRLDPDAANLTVYNMGVFVKAYNTSSIGIGGTVVSKKRLDVNFARNDVIQTCPVWRAIRKAIDASAGIARVKKKPILNDAERLNMIERFVAGELKLKDVQSMPLFVDTTGTPWSANKIRKADFAAFSYAEKGNHKGDKLIQSKRALVLNETLLRAFECEPSEIFTKEWHREGKLIPFNAPKFMPFSTLANEINDNYLMYPPEKYRKSEHIWIQIIDKMQYNLLGWGNNGKQRKIMIGDSCGKALAWTDGASFIVFDRSFLNRNEFLKSKGRPDVKSMIAVGTVLAHELCHDQDSRGGGHTPDFYKAFHDLCAGTNARLQYAIDNAYGHLTPACIERLFRDAKGEEPEGEKVAVAAAVVEPPKVEPKPEVKPDPEPKPEAKKGPGRTAAEVTDPKEIEKIALLYKENGGTLTFEGIEAIAELNLRVSRGMTAYRICQKWPGKN